MAQGSGQADGTRCRSAGDVACQVLRSVLHPTPKEDTLKSKIPLPPTVTLFGNRVVADAISGDGIRQKSVDLNPVPLHWKRQCKVSTGVLTREASQTQPHQERPHVRWGQGLQSCSCQPSNATDGWLPPEARKRQGRILPCRFQRDHGPDNSLTLNFWPPEG